MCKKMRKLQQIMENVKKKHEIKLKIVENVKKNCGNLKKNQKMQKDCGNRKKKLRKLQKNNGKCGKKNSGNCQKMMENVKK